MSNRLIEGRVRDFGGDPSMTLYGSISLCVGMWMRLPLVRTCVGSHRRTRKNGTKRVMAHQRTSPSRTLTPQKNTGRPKGLEMSEGINGPRCMFECE